MREQLRSLEQDIQNVQNGSSMLKTAHGGIENIVDELRSLKELSINAANDSNTDEDRKIIQKEFDQRRENIDEIAQWTTYNTKPLLDGTYRLNEKTVNVPTIGLVGVGEPTNTLDIVFAVDTTGSMSTYISKLAMNISDFADRLYDKGMDFRFGLVRYDDVTDTSGTRYGVSRVRFNTGTFTKDADEFEEKLRSLTVSGGGDEPDSGYEAILNEESGVISYNFRSSAEKRVILLTDSSAHDSADTSNPGEYTADDVISSLAENEISAYTIIRAADTTSTRYTDWARIANGTGGKTYDVSSDYGAALDDLVADIPDPENPIVYKKETEADGDPLVIHHGTKSNVRTNFYINAMTTTALKGTIPNEKDRDDLRHLNDFAHDREGIEKVGELTSILAEASGKSIADANVTNKHDAKVSIRIVDGALDYALDEATRLGAYLQRLEYTQENVTTQNENVQGAESTIRDADMAKEMTEYTKQNVIMQASQSMLAQANQNLSSVLSLLQ